MHPIGSLRREYESTTFSVSVFIFFSFYSYSLTVPYICQIILYCCQCRRRKPANLKKKQKKNQLCAPFPLQLTKIASIVCQSRHPEGVAICITCVGLFLFFFLLIGLTGVLQATDSRKHLNGFCRYCCLLLSFDGGGGYFSLCFNGVM